MFHQRLILFSISNTWNKLDQRQHDLTHIVLKMSFFSICVAFSNLLANSDQKTIQFEACCPFEDSLKNLFFSVPNICKKKESRMKQFDLDCP